MFELTKEELENWRYHFGTSNKEKMGLRIPPFAFTEHGILMLASVLNSERAIQVNIRIVRILTKLREMLLSQKELLERVRQIEDHITDHDEKIVIIFEYLKQFEQAKKQQENQENTKRIGYRNS